MPCSAWVTLARSRLLSLVEPPAPHVTLIAMGLRAVSRDIREIKFSNPWEGLRGRSVENGKDANLVCSRRKELKGIKGMRSTMCGDLISELHPATTIKCQWPTNYGAATAARDANRAKY